MVAPQKLGRVNSNAAESLRSDGAHRVMELIRALNKTYEDSSFIAGDSPAVHSFYGDMGYNSIQGWITCDGPGNISVAFSRDGITYGDEWTMRLGENTSLRGFDIHSIRVTRLTADSSYRIFLI